MSADKVEESSFSSRPVAGAPRVSVVLPTFNSATTLSRAIASILRQSYRDFELLIVDDGSTDETAAVLDTFEDSRIVRLALGSNSGAYAARNHAVAVARGELVAFTDADDEWLPEKLALQVALMDRSPDVVLVHTRVVDVFSDREVERALHPQASTYRGNLCEDRIAGQTVVVRAAALRESGGFDEQLRLGGDWDLWTRLLRDGRAAAISTPLARVHQTQGSLQRGGADRFADYRAQVLQKRRPELEAEGLYRSARAVQEYSVGAKLQLEGRRGEARRRLLASLWLRPSARALLMLGLTFFTPDRAGHLRFMLRRLRRSVDR